MKLEECASSFDEYHFAGGCGQRYKRDREWLGFFEGIADRFVWDISPKTELVAGCTAGFLVEALRDRGVGAYGIDVYE